MGSVAKITTRRGECIENALRVLAGLNAEGRLHSLLFIAQVDEDDETMGTFGDYTTPESLVLLTTRLHLRAQQGLLKSPGRRKAGEVRAYRRPLPTTEDA